MRIRLELCEVPLLLLQVGGERLGLPRVVVSIYRLPRSNCDGADHQHEPDRCTRALPPVSVLHAQLPEFPIGAS